MKYDSYAIGPLVRRLRVDRKLTQERVSELTGLSTSSIQQIEQGGRNMSINTLYLFMEVYKCDANTILNLHIDSSIDKENDSIDKLLLGLQDNEKNFLKKSFIYMIEQAKGMLCR